jgi:hypothetical protein
MIPRIRTTNVRSWNGCLRWTLVAGGLVITADTTGEGTVLGIQTLERLAGTGDRVLDDQIREHILSSLAQRRVHQRLDQLDGRRWGRILPPAERGWAA